MRSLEKEGTLLPARYCYERLARRLVTQTTLARSTEIANTRLSPHSSCGEGDCVDAFPYRIVLANCRKRREISPTRPSGLDIKKLETRGFHGTTLVSPD